MIVIKQIKPSRLKDDVFRLEALSGIHKAERGIKKDFEATQETWEDEDKAKFDSIISLQSPGPTVVVAPNANADIWIMVNEGTPEHDIAPKNAGGFLQFQTGYDAKTSPGVIGSVQGGKFGPTIRKRIVHHPGFAGRHFDKAIQKKWTPMFKRIMEDALRNAVAKCGHGVRG